jgi:hypothetical protein
VTHPAAAREEIRLYIWREERLLPFSLQHKIGIMVEHLYVGGVEDCGMRLTKL